MYAVFSKAYKHVLATDIDLNIDWLSPLDVRKYKDCERVFDEFKPHVVLHLAAHTDLEYCEKNQEDSWLTNALGTENIGLLATKRDCTMVYISTAGIMDGAQDFYTDFDEPNPLSHYAKSKYYGEIYVKTRVPKFFVFRPGWMMGGGPSKDKKFVNKIFQQIIAGKRSCLLLMTSLVRQLTPTTLPTRYKRCLRQSCTGSITRFAKAIAVATMWRLNLSACWVWLTKSR